MVVTHLVVGADNSTHFTNRVVTESYYNTLEEFKRDLYGASWSFRWARAFKEAESLNETDLVETYIVPRVYSS